MFDGLISLILLGVWIFGIFDVITTDPSAVRHLPKVAWVILVILLGPIGAGAWFLIGRPARGWQPAVAGPGASRWPRARERSARPAAEDPQQILANIEARDRLLAAWAEEDRNRGGDGDADRGPEGQGQTGAEGSGPGLAGA